MGNTGHARFVGLIRLFFLTSLTKNFCYFSRFLQGLVEQPCINYAFIRLGDFGNVVHNLHKNTNGSVILYFLLMLDMVSVKSAQYPSLIYTCCQSYLYLKNKH